MSCVGIEVDLAKVVKGLMVDDVKDVLKKMRAFKITLPFLTDVQEGRYSTNELLFYSALKMTENLVAERSMTITSVDVLLTLVNFSKHSRNRKVVIDSLNALRCGGLIKVYYDIGMSNENIDIQNADTLFIELTEREGSENFVLVRHFEFNEIVNAGERNPAKMLLMYLSIIINVYEKSDTRYTDIANEVIAYTNSLDKKTVTKYIQKLEDSKVLYRKLVHYKDIRNGIIKTKNIFTRYAWKDYVESRYL